MRRRRGNPMDGYDPEQAKRAAEQRNQAAETVKAVIDRAAEDIDHIEFIQGHALPVVDGTRYNSFKEYAETRDDVTADERAAIEELSSGGPAMVGILLENSRIPEKEPRDRHA